MSGIEIDIKEIGIWIKLIHALIDGRFSTKVSTFYTYQKNISHIRKECKL